MNLSLDFKFVLLLAAIAKIVEISLTENHVVGLEYQVRIHFVGKRLEIGKRLKCLQIGR